MKIETLVLGLLRTNCYILTNEATNKAIIVDPADQADEIIKQLEARKMAPVAILLTHGHFDHILAVEELIKHYQIPIYASDEEKKLLAFADLNCSQMMSLNCIIKDVIGLKDEEMLDLGGIPIKVIHTPGHTAGGLCYYIEKLDSLISGDTLFLESIGRTDLPTGNGETLISSIQDKLLTLPDETKVYPGHGEETSIGHERKNNPYLSNENFWD